MEGEIQAKNSFVFKESTFNYSPITTKLTTSIARAQDLCGVKFLGNTLNDKRDTD